MNLYQRALYVAIAGLMAGLSACNGILDGIYDTPPDDASIEEGFNAMHEPGRYTIYLDARAYDSWLYLDFDECSVTPVDIPLTLEGEWDGKSGWTYHEVRGTNYTYLSDIRTDAMPEPDDWDIAIHHFDVRTNGGKAMMTQYASIDDLPPLSQIEGEYAADVWGNTQVITDLAGMLAYRIGYQNSWHNPVLTTWVTMDFSTPPPIYSASGRVYLLKMADGRTAAMRLLDYMSPKGTKGYLTIDLKLYD